MKKTLIIRHKHIYQIWFIDFIRYLIAEPEAIDATINRLIENEDKYLNQLFKIGNLKPNTGATTASKVFQAHLEGLKIVGEQVKHFTHKYPSLSKIELTDARWIRFLVDWAGVLAGQAAASANSQSDDEGGPFDDPTRCVDAWIDYNDAIIEHGEAKSKLDDCLISQIPPVDEFILNDENPYGSSGTGLTPCNAEAMAVVVAENNVNAAWDDIRVWC